MSINARIIESEIGDAAFVRIRSRYDRYPLDTICLHSPQIPAAPNLIMVATAESLERATGEMAHGCIVSSGTPSAEWLARNRADIICLSESLTVEEVAARVSGILEHVHAWYTTLMRSIFKNESVQYLCEVSRDIFRADITVIASDFSILGRAVLPRRKHEPAITGRVHEYLDSDLVSLLLNSPDYMQTLSTREPGYYTPAYATSGIFQNIFLNDEFAARVMVDSYDAQLKDVHRALISILAESIQTALRTNTQPRNRYVSQLRSRLEGIFDEGKRFTRPLESYIEPLGWRMDDLYSIVALRPEQGLLNQGLLEYIGHAITTQVQGTVQLMVGKTLVIVYDYRVNGKDIWVLFDEMNDYLAHFALFAGLSQAFYDFSLVETYIRQAIAALECGLGNDIEGPTFFFPDVRLTYMLEHGLRSLPARALVSKEVETLLAYDDENGTQLYETLRTYVLNHLNKTDSAKKLFVHMSTFRYRLERIEELTELDLEDPDTMLYLMLVIKLLDEA